MAEKTPFAAQLPSLGALWAAPALALQEDLVMITEITSIYKIPTILSFIFIVALEISNG